MDLDKLNKEQHIHMYRMFCSSWIISEGGVHKIPIEGSRFVLDEILACGKISPDEALAIENDMREKIPELWEFISSLDKGLTNPDTQH